MPVLSSLSFSFLPSRLLAHEMVLPTLERHRHISRQLILKPPSQVCPEPGSSLGSLDPVEQIDHAADHRGRRMESNVGPLVPVEKDASSCSLYPHDCEAVSRWEADRQCFCNSSGELGTDERTGVETFCLELWEQQRPLSAPLCPVSGEKRKFYRWCLAICLMENWLGT